MIRAAFDIGTVSPDVPNTEKPEFGNPHHFEFRSGGIAIEENGEIVEKRHIRRDGWGAQHELAVIDDIAGCLLETNPEVTFTFNGERFDFFLMKERARICGEKLGDLETYERVQDIEATIGHEDLQPDVWARWGEYTRLEEAMVSAGIFDDEAAWRESQTTITDYEHGFDYQDWAWKKSWHDHPEILDGKDVGALGEEYLNGLEEGRDDEEFRELEAMLNHYVRNDVDHLFDLADARPY